MKNRYYPNIFKKIMCLLSAMAIALLLPAFNEGKSVNYKSTPSEPINPNPEKIGDEVKCGSVKKIYENHHDADIKVRVYVTDRCMDRESVVKIFDESNKLIMNFIVGYKKMKSRTVLVPTNGYVILECNGNKPKKNAFLYKCTYKVTEVL